MVRPMKVEEIASRAGNFEYNSQIPLIQWLRAADTIRKEARIYQKDGNDQQTYLLLLRHALLILEHLPTHPEAKNTNLRLRLNNANKTVKNDLAELETLKPKINNRYKDYRKREHVNDKAVTRPQSSERSYLYHHGQESDDPAIDGSKKPLQPSLDSELAIKLHTKEANRRNDARHTACQVGGVVDRNVGPSATRLREDLDNRKGQTGDGHFVDLSRLMPEVQINSEINEREKALPKHTMINATSTTDAIIYPKVPTKSVNEIAPTPPPKFLFESSETAQAEKSSIIPPSLPPKVLATSVPDNYNSTHSTVEHVDLALKSPSQELPNTSDFTFVASAYLENGSPLRTIFLPPNIRSKFLDVAKPNTERNLETCGFLCGTLVSNALFVSHLVIPDQESTSDTCEMTNESVLFDYCDAEELMVLGWIHTHPTQTCFMSSRDLHTHAGYQLMMAESIAIVCAPSKTPSWGIFRLTDPPGMKTVLGCHQTGLFHPHSEANIYTDALKPGHVLELPGLDYQLVDLRSP